MVNRAGRSAPAFLLEPMFQGRCDRLAFEHVPHPRLHPASDDDAAAVGAEHHMPCPRCILVGRCYRRDKLVPWSRPRLTVDLARRRAAGRRAEATLTDGWWPPEVRPSPAGPRPHRRRRLPEASLDLPPGGRVPAPWLADSSGRCRVSLRSTLVTSHARISGLRPFASRTGDDRGWSWSCLWG